MTSKLKQKKALTSKLERKGAAGGGGGVLPVGTLKPFVGSSRMMRTPAPRLLRDGLLREGATSVLKVAHLCFNISTSTRNGGLLGPLEMED